MATIHFKKDDETIFTCTPIAFRRVHSLNPNSLHLEYSHTDLVVRLESGKDVMIEFVQAKLSAANYDVVMNGESFPLLFNQNEIECINWCKKLVFTCFPNLDVHDVYGSKLLLPRHDF
jgi:hypothetical protein